MLKKFLGLTMAVAFLVIAGIIPVTAAEVPQMEEKSGDIKRSDLEPGWVANIYALMKGEDVTQLPRASMGNFKANKSGYEVNDYIQSLGFPIQNKTIMWHGQGYIIAEKKGFYVFALSGLELYSYGHILVNGTKIASGYSAGTIVGNTELEPGIHVVDFIFASSASKGDNAWGRVDTGHKFELRIKSPTDNTPVLAEKVLFRKK